MLGLHRSAAGVHQHKAARSIGYFDPARRGARLPEKGGLLVRHYTGYFTAYAKKFIRIRHAKI